MHNDLTLTLKNGMICIRKDVNMISYIELENFKSLTNFKVDFRTKSGEPKHIAFIYGENGSGKTNLVSAILFLSQSLYTLSNYLKLQDLMNNDMPEFLADIEEEEIRERVFKDLIANRFPLLSKLILENKTIDSVDDMKLKIGFYINGIEGAYEVRFDNTAVVFEELRYLVNERVGVLYSLDLYKNPKFSPSFILNAKYKNDLKEQIKKYWGKHTFMSIIFNEIYAHNSDFIKESLNKNFLSVLDWLNNISLSCQNYRERVGNVTTSIKCIHELSHGKTNEKDKRELLAMEDFLNSVFTKLYSDIKKVFYKFTKNDNVYVYQLYLIKQIGGNRIEVPFDAESTGTQKLLEVIEFVLLSLLGNTVIVDEMDSGIHDLLMYELIEIFLEALTESGGRQFIATTHNTLLMELLQNESVYVLTVDAHGNKEALSLDKYEFRTQKNHNKRTRYLKGDYAGIPYTGYIDFAELVDELKNQLHA